MDKVKTLATIKRGDTVVVEQHGYRRADPIKVFEAEVTASGPKYIAITEYNRPKRFHRDSGREVTEYECRAWIFADRAEYEAKAERVDLLRKAKDAVNDAGMGRLTNDQLRALIAILGGGA